MLTSYLHRDANGTEIELCMQWILGQDLIIKARHTHIAKNQLDQSLVGRVVL